MRAPPGLPTSCGKGNVLGCGPVAVDNGIRVLGGRVVDNVAERRPVNLVGEVAVAAGTIEAQGLFGRREEQLAGAEQGGQQKKEEGSKQEREEGEEAVEMQQDFDGHC